MADLGALLGAREPHLELLPLAQPLRHVVEGRREPADLVVAVDRNRHVEPSLGDLRRAVGERVERPRRVPGEDEHDREAEGEDAEEREEAPAEVVLELRPDVLEVVGDLDVSAEAAVDDDRAPRGSGSSAPSRCTPRDHDVLGRVGPPRAALRVAEGVGSKSGLPVSSVTLMSRRPRAPSAAV